VTLLYPRYQLAALLAASQIVPDKQACKNREFSAKRINRYLEPDANRRLPLQCKCTSPSQECDCEENATQHKDINVRHWDRVFSTTMFLKQKNPTDVQITTQH
jgi:hypothetical protein